MKEIIFLGNLHKLNYFKHIKERENLVGALNTGFSASVPHCGCSVQWGPLPAGRGGGEGRMQRRLLSGQTFFLSQQQEPAAVIGSDGAPCPEVNLCKDQF